MGYPWEMLNHKSGLPDSQMYVGLSQCRNRLIEALEVMENGTLQLPSTFQVTIGIRTEDNFPPSCDRVRLNYLGGQPHPILKYYTDILHETTPRSQPVNIHIFSRPVGLLAV